MKGYRKVFDIILNHDLFFLAIILFTGLKLTTSIAQVLDLQLYDEANYLLYGIRINEAGVLDASWGPLYSIWYFFLSVMESDSIKLLYLNYKLSLVLPVMLFYILLRKVHTPKINSVLISVFLMLSYALISPFPRISHFALIVIIPGLILFYNTDKKPRALLLLFSITMMGAYARPEFLLSSIFIFALYILLIIKSGEKILIRNELKLLIAFLIIASLLITFLGLPLFQGSERAFLAFSQHFSINWAKWTGNELNPFINHQNIIESNFGSINSLSEAIISNPVIVLKHIGSNIIYSLYHLAGIFTIHINLLIPGNNMSYAKIEGVALALIILLILIRFLISNKSKLRTILAKNSFSIIVISLMILPFLLSSVIIYPRHHYLLIIGTLLIVLICRIIFSNRNVGSKSSWLKNLILGLLIITLTPKIKSKPFLLSEYNKEAEYKLQHLKTVNYIRSLNIKDKVKIMDGGMGFTAYLPDNYENAEISDTIDLKKVKNGTIANMILINKELWSFASDDEPWLKISRNYKEYGFIKFEVPDIDKYSLLIHKNIIGKKVQ